MKLRSIRTALSHVCMVVSLMIVVFFVIDRFNPAMEFMTSEMSKWLILGLAVASFSNGLLNIVRIRHAIRAKRVQQESEGGQAARAEQPVAREAPFEQEYSEETPREEVPFEEEFPEMPFEEEPFEEEPWDGPLAGTPEELEEKPARIADAT